MIDRTKLSDVTTYALLVDSLTGYGGINNATTHDYLMPVDGIFRVSREHYSPEAEPDEGVLYSGDGDDQMNNVRICLAFAVDWQRLKLLLADAEYDLEEAEPRWTDTRTWVVMGDGFNEALCLCQFTHLHYPKDEMGVCFLAEWEMDEKPPPPLTGWRFWLPLFLAILLLPWLADMVGLTP